MPLIGAQCFASGCACGFEANLLPWAGTLWSIASVRYLEVVLMPQGGPDQLVHVCVPGADQSQTRVAARARDRPGG